jgi:hypothetical protein
MLINEDFVYFTKVNGMNYVEGITVSVIIFLHKYFYVLWPYPKTRSSANFAVCGT